MTNQEMATLFLNLATAILQQPAAKPQSSVPIQPAVQGTIPVDAAQQTAVTHTPAPAVSAMQQTAPTVVQQTPQQLAPHQLAPQPVQPSPQTQIPANLQQLLQEMHRQGATFDLPPQTNIYDRLSDHLASIYSASGDNVNNPT